MTYSSAPATEQEILEAAPYLFGQRNGHNPQPLFKLLTADGLVVPFDIYSSYSLDIILLTNGHSNRDSAAQPERDSLMQLPLQGIYSEMRRQNAHAGQILSGIGGRAQRGFRIKHHPAIGKSPGKVAAIVSSERCQSLEAFLETAGL